MQTYSNLCNLQMQAKRKRFSQTTGAPRSFLPIAAFGSFGEMRGSHILKMEPVMDRVGTCSFSAIFRLWGERLICAIRRHLLNFQTDNNRRSAQCSCLHAEAKGMFPIYC